MDLPQDQLWHPNELFRLPWSSNRSRVSWMRGVHNEISPPHVESVVYEMLVRHVSNRSLLDLALSYRFEKIKYNKKQISFKEIIIYMKSIGIRYQYIFTCSIAVVQWNGSIILLSDWILVLYFLELFSTGYAKICLGWFGSTGVMIGLENEPVSN